MPVYDPHAVEAEWQRYWEQKKTFQVSETSAKPKLYVLDMFPYASDEGLHVGHSEGYIATDMFCRFQRMKGYNVLHPMGYDAFGLPAEQHAVETGTAPGIAVDRSINNMRRQAKRLGFSCDWDRELVTTDPRYVRWTQWIFLVLFDTWFDRDYEWVDNKGKKRIGKGRPIAELPIPEAVKIQGEESVRRYRDSARLAYYAEGPANWCAALGTALADEEVIDGRSEYGNYPVKRIVMRRWMLRITAYAERLVEDLDEVQWPDGVKETQKNWIGRSEGAEVDVFVGAPSAYGDWISARRKSGFPENEGPEVVRIYTPRPDALFGATFLALSPEHPLADALTAEEHKKQVEEYRSRVSGNGEEERAAGDDEITGVFTGRYGVNPINGEKIPVWIADYVLPESNTGATLAIPGHDQRDLQFAQRFELPVKAVVAPPEAWLASSLPEARLGVIALEKYAERAGDLAEAFEEEGTAMESENEEVNLNGLPSPQAKRKMTEWLAGQGIGRAAVRYRLRDWLFGRHRYWGEPIPILHELDSNGKPSGLTQAVPEEELPVMLPDIEDCAPAGRLGNPLEKADRWTRVQRGGREYARETTTMPQWAGSCWYYLRFCDPENNREPWDAAKERYWMPVDLYVGGAEHAVLHLLYSRFWHKVLFDRGYVSTIEPFQRLVNPGTILAASYRTSGGKTVPYSQIRFGEGKAHDAGTGEELGEETEKMSKSRGNAISVDVPIQRYGSDAVRLYEMYMGPLESAKPWSMQGLEEISRFLDRSWRMIVDESADPTKANPRLASKEEIPGEEQLRLLHRTISSVTKAMGELRFDDAIRSLMEFADYFMAQDLRHPACMESFVLMLSPMAPHIAEELWKALGHAESLAYEPWPVFDPQYAREEES